MSCSAAAKSRFVTGTSVSIPTRITITGELVPLQLTVQISAANPWVERISAMAFCKSSRPTAAREPWSVRRPAPLSIASAKSSADTSFMSSFNLLRKVTRFKPFERLPKRKGGHRLEWPTGALVSFQIPIPGLFADISSCSGSIGLPDEFLQALPRLRAEIIQQWLVELSVHRNAAVIEMFEATNHWTRETSPSARIKKFKDFCLINGYDCPPDLAISRGNRVGRLT